MLARLGGDLLAGVGFLLWLPLALVLGGVVGGVVGARTSVALSWEFYKYGEIRDDD